MSHESCSQLPEWVPESEALNENRLPREGRVWVASYLKFEGPGAFGSGFVLVLKAVEMLQAGERPSA